jgi:tetratricopeptide (TPR) repeat protein
MKTVLTLATTFMLFNLFSCGQNKETKSFKVFNEGVALNLQSITEQEKGNYDKALEFNKQSIEKFKETLKLDSTHTAVRSALGHSLYIDKQFKEAIHWFEESNRLNGEQVQNYRELGLCKVNLGQIKLGKADIDKAFSMDKSKEIRDLTLLDLADIGNLAFEYGQGYEKDGELEKGKNYKVFSIGVLMLVYEYDNSKKDIALKISDFADKIGDKETALKYKQLANK